MSVPTPHNAAQKGQIAKTVLMVHQHFKLVECFTVLDNIIMGVEPCKAGFLQKKEAREKVVALSEKYGLKVDPDALVRDITVGMQQRTEILKMLYRENEILIFDEPTAVLTPQEIDELMQIMLYSSLLAVACINFKADQTLVGTALNLLGTAAATVIVKAINSAENPDNVSATIQYVNAKKAFLVNFGSFEFNWFMIEARTSSVASQSRQEPAR